MMLHPPPIRTRFPVPRSIVRHFQLLQVIVSSPTPSIRAASRLVTHPVGGNGTDVSLVFSITPISAGQQIILDAALPHAVESSLIRVPFEFPPFVTFSPS